MKKILLILCLSVAFVSCNKDDDSGNENCSTPGSISAVQINSTSIRFTWDDSVGTAFQFEYGPAGFELGNGIVVSTSQSEYLINNLLPSTAYTIRLRNNCGSNGFSGYKNFDFTTSQPVVTCNPPLNLARVLLGSDFVQINWDENNETAWEIEYGLVGHPIGTGTVVATSQNNYTIGGLSSGTTYEIYVRANCGSDGFSEYTPALVVTTD